MQDDLGSHRRVGYWDRRRREQCDCCGRPFMASGPQTLCAECRERTRKEQHDVSMTRRAKPVINYCPCGKPCAPGEEYCSRICEQIGGLLHGTL